MTKLHGGLQSVAIGSDRKRAKAVGKRRPLTADRRTRSRVTRVGRDIRRHGRPANSASPQRLIVRADSAITGRC